MNALLIVYMENEKYKEALGIIDRMNKIPTTSEWIRWEIFLTTSGLKLEIYHSTAEFEKGLRFYREVIAKVKAHDMDIRGTWQSANFLHGCLFNFYNGNFKEALRLLNRAIDETPIRMFEQEYCFLRILNLMIHFELGDEGLLESSIRSTYRALSKRNQLNGFEQLVLKFVKENVGVTAEGERRNKFIRLKEDLARLSKDPKEKKIIDTFRIGLWVDKRIRQPLEA